MIKYGIIFFVATLFSVKTLSSMQADVDAVADNVGKLITFYAGYKTLKSYEEQKKKLAQLDVSGFNTAFINLQNNINITHPDSVKNFSKAYVKLFSALNIMHDFEIGNAVFTQLDASLKNLQVLMTQDNFIRLAQAHAGGFETLFNHYREYSTRYFINYYLANLHKDDARALVSADNFNEFTQNLKTFVNTLFPDDFMKKFQDNDLVEEKEFKKIKNLFTKINAIIKVAYMNFKKDDWPQMLAAINTEASIKSDEERKKYLNIVNIILTTFALSTEDEVINVMEQLLPEMRELNGVLKDLDSVQPFLIDGNIPLLADTEKKLGKAVPPEPPLEPEVAQRYLTDLTIDLASLADAL